jgi:exodeoxyribonuclease-5
LENVHRQSADNPIVQLAHQVRQPGAVAFRSNYDGESGVAVTDSAEGFVESALRTFQSDAFRKDATTARVLAYRNKTVRAYNRRIRQALYGDDAERFTKGEWLMIRETWYYNNMPYLKNSEEVRVKKAQTDTYEAEDGSEWKVWRLSVKSVRDAWNRIALVLHEDEHERFEEELERKKMDAKESPRKWERYYELKERFTQVDYAYATTTHKAQGSTFDTVFVDYRDLQACRGPEQQALLYVAITRPSRRLAMLV